jgi:hypothetical protein
MQNIVIDLDCEKQVFESLRCSCGAWSRLSFDAAEVRADGVRISGSLPTLVCDKCGQRRLPLNAQVAMCDLSAEARRRGTSAVKVDFVNAAGSQTRFDFCADANLLYSSLDTKYMPGLAVDGGFLTPVFFSKDALTYFYHHPDYAVTFESDTYGTLRGGDGFYVSFGLTRAGKVVMWLGDLNSLSRQVLMTLAAHNVESDHDIAGEFYEGQIEAEFTDISQEKHTLRAQGELVSGLFQHHGGLKLLLLDNEGLELLPALRRPLHFSELEFGNAMEVMTKLFVERINGPALKEDLRPGTSPDVLEKIKKFGGLKTLQTWLEQKVNASSAGEMMLPLFVLYDFRVAYKHLIPAEKQAQTKGSCLQRLGLAPDAALEKQYDALVQQLRNAFEAMRDVVNERSKQGRL